jgi:hypothetical protein
MADQEKIGVNEFKNFLLEKFANDENIDNISKQFSNEKRRLEEELGKEIPTFYSDAKNYMSVNDIAIDSSGQIDVNVVKQIAQIAKKEVERQEFFNNEANQSSEQNDLDIDQENLVQLQKEYSQIDFENLTSKDFSWIVDNIEYFIENSTEQDFQNVTEEMKNQLGLSEEVSNLFTLFKKSVDGKELTKQEKEIYNEGKDNLAKILGIDTNKEQIDDEKIRSVLQDLYKLTFRIKEQQEAENRNLTAKELEDLKNSLSNPNVFNLIDEEILKSNEKLKQLNEQLGEQLSKQSNEFENDITDAEEVNGMHEENNDGISNTEFGRVDFDGMFGQWFMEIEDPAEILSVDDAELQEETNEMSQVDDVIDKSITEEVKSIAKEPEEVKGVEKEAVEEAKTELKDYEMEIDEPKGLAGFFAKIKNSKAVKAVTNLFKTKDEQKRLNAAVTERTDQNGVKITEYEDKGKSSLDVPMSIRFREFAIRAGDAVTNFIQSRSQSKGPDIPINRPTIVGKDDKDKTQEEQTQNIDKEQTRENNNEITNSPKESQVGQYADNNQWAVDLGTLGNAQGLNNQKNKDNNIIISTNEANNAKEVKSAPEDR